MSWTPEHGFDLHQNVGAVAFVETVFECVDDGFPGTTKNGHSRCPSQGWDEQDVPPLGIRVEIERRRIAEVAEVRGVIQQISNNVVFLFSSGSKY